jgi:hypothetical protein
MIHLMAERYVFRGTTIGYKGNNAALTIPYTCTSTHPVKALLFALECMSQNPFTAVVYFAELKKLSGTNIIQNCLSSMEDEIAFEIKPEAFYPLCEGYVHVFDLQNIMNNLGIYTPYAVQKTNLSLLCQETPSLTQKDLVTIISAMRKIQNT